LLSRSIPLARLRRPRPHWRLREPCSSARRESAAKVANQLITKTAVFIGYRLEDPDFRQIWHVVFDRLGRTRRKAYTIAVNARAADVARYERRGVKVINLPGPRDKYGDMLGRNL
jgi:hypothetical protein